MEVEIMGIASFTDPWYAQKIDQAMDGWDNASVDNRIIANAILVGFAMVAQAIDNSFGHTAAESENNALSALQSMACEMMEIANGLNPKK
jgi:hypothetical protein